MSALMVEDRTYEARRSQIETYFDRTAAETWRRLTSDAPVSGIRATVRAGRDRMRATLLGRLPADLTGRRLYDEMSAMIFAALPLALVGLAAEQNVQQSVADLLVQRLRHLYHEVPRPLDIGSALIHKCFSTGQLNQNRQEDGNVTTLYGRFDSLSWSLIIYIIFVHQLLSPR